MLFWLLSALAKEYSTNVEIPVKYSGIPQGKMLSEDPPPFLTALIKGKGFELIKYRISMRDTLSVNVFSYLKGQGTQTGFILTEALIDRLSRQLSMEVRLLRLKPDTLFFKFSAKAVKRVPVKLDIDLKFENQYRLTEDIKISPESITVEGPEGVLEKIKYIESEKLLLENIKETLKTSIPLKFPENIENISLSNSKVNIEIYTDKFTEHTFQIPIEVINLPKDVDLKIFPNHVSVKFLVPLSKFEKIREGLFKAVVDASQIMSTGDSKLKVELTKSPAEVTNVSIYPDKVEFIIKR